MVANCLEKLSLTRIVALTRIHNIPYGTIVDLEHAVKRAHMLKASSDRRRHASRDNRYAARHLIKLQ